MRSDGQQYDPLYGVSDGIFHDDIPQSEDSLWVGNAIVRQFRQQVVRMILSGRTSSCTIAIHGQWGSGKTSLWKQIKQELVGLARRTRVELCCVEISVDMQKPQAKGQRDSFFAQLVREIVLNLDDSLREQLFDQMGLLREWQQRAAAIGVESQNQTRAQQAATQSKQGELAEFLRTVEFERLIEEVFANQVRFTDWLKKELTEGGMSVPGERRIVVCIDDLDRCSPSQVTEVVSTVRRFHEVPMVYVFLLVDEDVLRDAFRVLLQEYTGERPQEFSGVPTVDAALERYINLVFHLPKMSLQTAIEYVLTLIGRIPSDPLSREVAPYLVNLIPQDKLTPRAIKRVLNQFYSGLSPDLLTDINVLKRKAKIAILTQYYKTVAKIQRENILLFEAIERAFDENRTRDQESLRSDLRSIFEKYSRFYRVPQGVQEQLLQDLDLKRILEEPPFIQYQPDQSASNYRELPPPSVDQGTPVEMSLPEGQDLGDFLTGSREPTVASLLPEAAAALLTRNEIAIQNALRRVLDAARNKSDAPYLASIAQIARQAGLSRYALPLFQKALELDPNHEDILQAYVGLVLDERIEAHYERAEKCVDRLLNDPSVPKDDLPFTLSLAVQLAVIRGGDYEEFLHRLLDFWAQRKDINLYRRIMLALNAVKSVDEARALRHFCQIYRDSIQLFTEEADIYLITRTTADFLAGMSDAESEFQAMDLYREMLLGHVRITDEDDLADIMHNYATLLYKHDYDAAAGEIWYEAYHRKRGDLNIRRGFMAYLLRYGAPDLVQRVLHGEPFEREQMPKVAPRALPERFARWRPCEGGGS